MARFEADFLEEYSDAALLAELRRVGDLSGDEPLTQARFRKLGGLASPDTIRQRFGGWDQALARAGLGRLYCGKTVTEKMKSSFAKQLSDDEVLQELQRVAASSPDGMVRYQTFASYSSISTKAVESRFGSWRRAVELAGLERPQYGGRYSREDYFSNLAAVWERLGRRPLLREMDEAPSTISSGGYEQRFKGWRRAVYAFLRWIESPEETTAADAPVPTIAETTSDRVAHCAEEPSFKRDQRRNVPLRMRWFVLERDRFTCQGCGRSRAKGDDIKLHADHVVSWTDGGPTVPENLRALCSDCNIGKGPLSSNLKGDSA